MRIARSCDAPVVIRAVARKVAVPFRSTWKPVTVTDCGGTGGSTVSATPSEPATRWADARCGSRPVRIVASRVPGMRYDRRALGVRAFMKTVGMTAWRNGRTTGRLRQGAPGGPPRGLLTWRVLLPRVTLTRRDPSAIPDVYRPKRSRHVLPASRPSRAGCTADRHTDRERAGSSARLDPAPRASQTRLRACRVGEP